MNDGDNVNDDDDNDMTSISDVSSATILAIVLVSGHLKNHKLTHTGELYKRTLEGAACHVFDARDCNTVKIQIPGNVKCLTMLFNPVSELDDSNHQSLTKFHSKYTF